MTDIFDLNKSEIGKYFDYSVLPKQSTEQEIRVACREAVKYNCAAFYTASPFWSPIVREELQGTSVLVATGIDFPFGVSSSRLKAIETEQAIEAGCGAVDIVMNIGALRSGNYDLVKSELRDFVKAAGGALTKVIIEVCYLSDEEIAVACKLIAESGANYAKTSTGQFEGPSMSQFLVMKETLKDTGIKLKVAGVKFPRPQNAYTFILAGAELIGTRAAPEIIDAFDQIKTIYRK
ncbi:MAG: deoxyribose-phosphate aldolase [Planctomycetaceae bacterium]|jgi:deoxyribose-phosphate aldolase|nr:deoxyribose-phosphate aldolase [Planctomycetaceae bacterium]